jgi:hypothetical protein
MLGGETSTSEKFLGVIGALAGVVAVSFRVYTHYKVISHRRFVKNIYKKLNAPFVPLSPSYGPVFRRPSWKKWFLDLIRSQNAQSYICYYGANEAGKSIAVTQALKDETGVIYIPLRGVGSEQSIPGRFGHTIGYFGNEEIDPKISMETLLHALKDACEEYKYTHHKKKVIIIVDDIHKQIDKMSLSFNPLIADMAQEFVDLYASGLINVVYLVSEYNSVPILKNLSGHCRLSSLIFPTIPDDELFQDLSELARTNDVNPSVPAYLEWAFFKKVELRSPYYHIFPNDEDVMLLVTHIGSHIGSLVDAIQKIVDKKMPLQNVIDDRIQDIIPAIENILTGFHHDKLLELPISVTKPAFIIVTWEIFELLSVHEKIAWKNLIKVKDIRVTTEALREIILILVQMHVLTYDTYDEVKFHKRIMKYGFLKVRENDFIQRSLRESTQFLHE